MFVVIEGLDGVGKTTLVNALAEHYEGKPANTPGPLLQRLTDPILDALGDNQTARCLFYAASVLSEGKRARRAADRGSAVFMDRYWLSTIAYARARGVSVDLSSLEAVVPVPDVTVLLTLEEPQRRQRLDDRDRDRSRKAADMETLDHEFREAVLREMRCRTRAFGLQPVEVDVTGANKSEAQRRVLAVLPFRGDRCLIQHTPV
ncbi:MAG: AAA family ATPase [Chloroflexota bacterium]|nr:AAA family ATPase [Chloroflexota bacterium]